MLKKSVLAFATLVVCVLFTMDVFAVPYDSYNYDYRGRVVFTPPAYKPLESVSGADLGIGDFVNPQDVHSAEDGSVYVADTGNNRVVRMNQDLTQVLEIIDGFDDGRGWQTFNSPSGLTVSSTGAVYIADSNNRRIVALDEGGFAGCIQNPQSDVLPVEFVFTPLKVEVDYAGRVYAIAKGMFQGLMQFDSDGAFVGFYGTINVKITPWQKFWQHVFSKEQRQRGLLFIPTEFTGISLDDKGFLYASNIDDMGEKAVRRLNPSGQDVIQAGLAGNLGGDVRFDSLNDYDGPSKIADVAAMGKGMYSLLDAKRGRVFTYDREGELLYIFGGLGTQKGTFRAPVAITRQLSGRILVLDAIRGEIMVFSVTPYGALINDAVALRYDGRGAEAYEKWLDVLTFNENFELANIGVGKAHLSVGDNAAAMRHFMLVKDRAFYSIAFKRYRSEWIKDHLGQIAVCGFATIISCLFIKLFFKRHVKKIVVIATANDKLDKLKSLFGVIAHPIDTFYEIRHRNAGSVVLALATVSAFSVGFSFNRLYANFVVNATDPGSVELFPELCGVLLFFALFCAANWSVACLMDGEGRLKDIVNVTGYAFLPASAAFPLATLISGFLASGEETYYAAVIAIGIAWTIALVVSGIMTAHGYTLAKTLCNLVLTAASALAILFLSILLISLMSQAFEFLYNIYRDLSLTR